MEFLKNFSNTNSFGIPVGGPASRILSELVLNQIDRLLRGEGIQFCRFADDYHLFSSNRDEAYSHLLFLSEKLLQNQGLQLQKAKTRFMSKAEFSATSPLHLQDEAVPDEEVKPDLPARARGLLRFSLRFDPYSPTAHEDYELLRREIERFDILDLLKSELSKTRIHISLARKIINALKFIEAGKRDAAIVALVQNPDLLYPVFSSVMLVAKSTFEDLSDVTQVQILESLIELIKNNSHVLRVELNLLYAIRLLGSRQITGSEDLLSGLYKATTSPLIRRDIILVMARWGVWYWLSDLRNQFRTFSPQERRAFIVASYRLADEGSHWRQYIQQEFTPLEKLTMSWAAQKVQSHGWTIPI